MLTYSLFDGDEIHPSPYCQNQPRTVGEALEQVVQVFSNNCWYTAWVEDVGEKIVKIGSYGMAGETWIYVYEGPSDEIASLADVCYWFYKTTGNASDELKAKMRREEYAVGFQHTVSTSASYRPPHGGYPAVAA